jgi:hypothetical protein
MRPATTPSGNVLRIALVLGLFGLVFLVGAWLVSCAESVFVDEGPSPPPPGIQQPDTPGRATDEEIYEDVRFYCSAFTPRRLAESQGIDETDPMSVALAVADDYAPEAQRAAAEGCYDGLTR